jgi:hypothetical protein
MAELLALGAAARLAVAAFSALSAMGEIDPKFKALQLRIIAVASNVSVGTAVEGDPRVAPLNKAIQEATVWAQKRKVKLETQHWMHKAVMSSQTQGKIERFDGEIAKCASIPRHALRAPAARRGQSALLSPHASKLAVRPAPSAPAVLSRLSGRGALVSPT